MTNEVLQAIEARRSCRSYEERQILPEELSAVTRAGTWAPTGMGRQAVKIVVVQDPETVAKLERMNAAVLGDPDAHPFYGAPTGLSSVSPGSRFALSATVSACVPQVIWGRTSAASVWKQSA